MLRQIWVNLAYNSIQTLVNKKVNNTEVKKVITKVLETLKKLVALLTDDDSNDTQQVLQLWQQEKQQIAEIGLEYAIEIIEQNVTDETTKLIVIESAKTLAETLKLINQPVIEL